MVSVILPSYNHAPYLKQRIESILSQTYNDFELIILDDKSKDNSRDIIETYRSHPKVSLIVYNEVNSGTTFKQWKKGIELSKGDYIWIAESDDYADPEFLKESIALIKRYNSILCFSRSYIVNEFDKIIRTKDLVLDNEFCDSTYFLAEKLLYGNAVYNASMVVFKKDAVDDIIWEDLITFKYCGDWFFWAKLLMKEKGSVAEVKKCLNYFRTHTANVSNKSEVLGISILEGFPISKMIFNYLNIESETAFRQKWFEQWQYLRSYYIFSKNINLRIFFMFIKKCPQIAFKEVRRLFLRFINIY